MNFLKSTSEIKQFLKKVKPFAIRYSTWKGETVIVTCIPVDGGKRPLWDVIFNGKQNKSPLSSKEVGKLAAGCLTALHP